MPLDVIMPALGMAQDTGLIVAWIKQPGEAVAAGDVLFEVETDKATMEVEAAGDGFLTHVTAAAGEAVPVGNVIAKISETADAGGRDATSAQASAGASSDDALPEGQTVIMPTLGMAQDTGLLIAWTKQPGEAVAADDVLFEVENDKSTVEVPAGFDGYLAAVLAAPGENVPVGQTIAIISKDQPASPIVRSADSGATSAPAPQPAATSQASTPPAAKPAAAAKKAAVSQDGRILASPKARRLALEQGLDLARLAAAGHPQPFHVSDLEVLRSMPAFGSDARISAPAKASLRLTALVEAPGFDAFALWASEQGHGDSAALLAGFAAASAGHESCVAVEGMSQTQSYQAPLAGLSAVQPCVQDDCQADLVVRDLRWSRITSLAVGSAAAPTISLVNTGAGLELTLEADADRISAQQAIALLSNFADRMAQPLRHLL
jgi:pyruvate dehydrogenase E2 component (dihydrolipoamide acetyltransferase)/2-oxoglutarate dehydrogenase E2 component (dihydrolipoamide succinyltransferase)